MNFLQRIVSGSAHQTETQTQAKSLRIISFFGGDSYYYECAERLRQRCEELGVAYDLVEVRVDTEVETWADICRKKIPFYLEMLRKHEQDIMWVDVDTELLRSPVELAEGNFDMGAFMRGFQYLPKYNPAVFARTLHPGYLLFKYKPRTIQFLEECCALNEASDLSVTDDYILEEALRNSQTKMRFMLFSPDDVQWRRKDQAEGAIFRHGDSGNVAEFKDKVEQHLPRVLEPQAEAVVLRNAIQESAKRGKRIQVAGLRLRLVDVMPEDVGNYASALQLLKVMKDAYRLEQLLVRGSQHEVLRPYAQRFRMVTAFENKEWEKAEFFYNKLRECGDQKVLDLATSRRERFLRDRRAAELNIPDSDRVKLFWWEEPYPGNLGDIINPYVIEKMTGIPPKYAPAGVGMCAIGSVIKYAKENVPVWGSGSPRLDAELNPKAIYHAVRGPHTRELVMKNGGTCPEVYGDPAWFLPVLHATPVERTHKTGLILHFTHEDSNLPVDEALRQIPIRRVGYEDIEDFLDEMRSCDRIVSSSLHGVIIAHAYGIPALWATVTESKQQIHGDGIKFQDYFLSVGITEEQVPLDLSTLDVISDRTLPEEMFTLPKQKIDLEKLAKAAPFDVKSDILKAAAEFMAT